MTTKSATERHSQTVYRAVAVAETPIATRRFVDERWSDKLTLSVQYGTDVRKQASEWIQRLERETGRELAEGSTVTIRVETKTIRRITITDTISRTESILTLDADRYGNIRWKDIAS